MNGKKYIASQHSLSSKPIGISSASPTDARSYYYDDTVFLRRAYISKAEALEYLEGQAREGHFPIWINSTGTLTNGVITGGKVEEWIFLGGTTDANLVRKDAVLEKRMDDLIAGLKGTVPTDGDTLKKLYDKILAIPTGTGGGTGGTGGGEKTYRRITNETKDASFAIGINDDVIELSVTQDTTIELLSGIDLYGREFEFFVSRADNNAIITLIPQQGENIKGAAEYIMTAAGQRLVIRSRNNGVGTADDPKWDIVHEQEAYEVVYEHMEHGTHEGHLEHEIRLDRPKIYLETVLTDNMSFTLAPTGNRPNVITEVRLKAPLGSHFHPHFSSISNHSYFGKPFESGVVNKLSFIMRKDGLVEIYNNIENPQLACSAENLRYIWNHVDELNTPRVGIPFRAMFDFVCHTGGGAHEFKLVKALSPTSPEIDIVTLYFDGDKSVLSPFMDFVPAEADLGYILRWYVKPVNEVGGVGMTRVSAWTPAVKPAPYEQWDAASASGGQIQVYGNDKNFIKKISGTNGAYSRIMLKYRFTSTARMFVKKPISKTAATKIIFGMVDTSRAGKNGTGGDITKFSVYFIWDFSTQYAGGTLECYRLNPDKTTFTKTIYANQSYYFWNLLKKGGTSQQVDVGKMVTELESQGVAFNWNPSVIHDPATANFYFEVWLNNIGDEVQVPFFNTSTLIPRTQ